MFFHIFKNRLKILLRKKSVIFWTMIFPIILATLFHLAFSDIQNDEKLKVIDVAVIKNEQYDNNQTLRTVLESVSKDDDNKLFNIKYVDESEAKQLLENGDIDGYILPAEKTSVIVKENGINQTVIKYVIEQTYQYESVATKIYEYNPESLKKVAIDIFFKENQYFNDSSSKNMDMMEVEFYTLIGMACLYGGFLGLMVVDETTANLSTKGARTSIAPVHKMKVLLISLLVSFIIQYIEILILIGYLYCILGVSFGGNIGYVCLLSLFGCLAGTSLGLLVGVSSKKSDGIKTGIVLAITMTLSFFAGMMGVYMKYVVQNNAPILAKINPVNMITDGFYSLYYYDTMTRYYNNIISLAIFSAIMITISYIFIRRQKYDSI